jgi:hypothetical protein
LEAKPASDFDMQNMLEISGTAKVSLDNMVSWSNRFITMSAGSRNQETSGYHDITFPAVGTLIPHSNGTNVTVVAATAGQTGLSGGVLLNIWESLWYFVPRGTSAGSVAGYFRIQAYSNAASAANGPTVDGSGTDGPPRDPRTDCIEQQKLGCAISTHSWPVTYARRSILRARILGFCLTP